METEMIAEDTPLAPHRKKTQDEELIALMIK